MPEEVCKVKIQKKSSTSSTPALTTTMSSKLKDMEAGFKIYLAKKQETAMEMLTGFAVNGEECRKLGCRPEQPPLRIVNYPGASPCAYPLLELKVELELIVNYAFHL